MPGAWRDRKQGSMAPGSAALGPALIQALLCLPLPREPTQETGRGANVSSSQGRCLAQGLATQHWAPAPTWSPGNILPNPQSPELLSSSSDTRSLRLRAQWQDQGHKAGKCLSKNSKNSIPEELMPAISQSQFQAAHRQGPYCQLLLCDPQSLSFSSSQHHLQETHHWVRPCPRASTISPVPYNGFKTLQRGASTGV